jgi:hypothetical protein
MSQRMPSVKSPRKISAKLIQQCSMVSISKKWSSHPYPESSSSGPSRYVAPSSFARWMDVIVRRRFPSKSRDHWFKLQVATTASRIANPKCFHTLRCRVVAEPSRHLAMSGFSAEDQDLLSLIHTHERAFSVPVKDTHASLLPASSDSFEEALLDLEREATESNAAPLILWTNVAEATSTLFLSEVPSPEAKLLSARIGWFGVGNQALCRGVVLALGDIQRHEGRVHAGDKVVLLAHHAWDPVLWREDDQVLLWSASQSADPTPARRLRPPLRLALAILQGAWQLQEAPLGAIVHLIATSATTHSDDDGSWAFEPTTQPELMQDTPIPPALADAVHLVVDKTQYSAGLSWTVLRSEGSAIVVHPDRLLSPTRIAGVVPCLRRAVLAEMTGGTPSDRPHEAVWGRLKHSLFELALRHKFSLDEPDIPPKKHLSHADMEPLVGKALQARSALEDLVQASIPVTTAEQVLRQTIPVIQAIVNEFGPVKSPPSHDLRDHEARSRAPDTEQDVPPVHSVLSTEQTIVSPLWGLAGVLDAIISVRKRPSRLQTIPLELKSGDVAATGGVRLAHRAQATLYGIMLQDAATRKDGRGALMLYLNSLKPGSVERPKFADLFVHRSWPETRALLRSRNDLAIAMERALPLQPQWQTFASPQAPTTRPEAVDVEDAAPTWASTRLPPVEAPEGLCSRCFMLTYCAAYAAAESHRETNGPSTNRSAPTSGSQPVERAITTPARLPSSSEPLLGNPAIDSAAEVLAEFHKEYLARWLHMIDLEAQESDLRDTGLVPPWANARVAQEETDHGEPVLSMECRYTIASSTNSAETSESDRDESFRIVLECPEALEHGVTVDEWVSVSIRVDGRSVWNCSKGRVVTVDPTRVELQLMDDVFAAATISCPAFARGSTPLFARIDKASLPSGSRLSRSNVLELLAPSTDRGAGTFKHERLVELLVNLAAPVFGEDEFLDRLMARVGAPLTATPGVVGSSMTEPLPSAALKAQPERGSPLLVEAECEDEVSELAAALSELNPGQLAAVQSVCTARDYALVQGMPGTGKSSVLSLCVRIAVASGKRILLSAYTHSAVDNILLKVVPHLRKWGHHCLRLGASRSVHPDVRAMGVCAADLGREAAGGGGYALEELQVLASSAMVVATTCLGVNSSLLCRPGDTSRFDLCILDEASQLVEAVTLGPLLRCRRFALFGDHDQLPPLVLSPRAQALGMDVSLFRRLAECVKLDGPERALRTLRMQYRMNADIMLLANLLVNSSGTERGLVSGCAFVAARSLFSPELSQMRALLSVDGWDWLARLFDPRHRVGFVCTDACGAGVGEEELSGRGGGALNRLEAELVGCIVRSALVGGCSPSSVCVIAPYRAQLSLIAGRLGECLSPREAEAVEVATVDRFQGRDKDLVIVSLVRHNDRGDMGSLLSDVRRVNVMVTRARRKLIFVGSLSTLSLAPEGHVMRRLEHAVSEVGAILRMSEGHLHDPVALEALLASSRPSKRSLSAPVDSPSKRAGLV